MAVQNFANSFTIKSAVEFSLTAKTARNMIKSAECLNVAKLKVKRTLQTHYIDASLKSAVLNVLKFNLWQIDCY